MDVPLRTHAPSGLAWKLGLRNMFFFFSRAACAHPFQPEGSGGNSPFSRSATGPPVPPVPLAGSAAGVGTLCEAADPKSSGFEVGCFL